MPGDGRCWSGCESLQTESISIKKFGLNAVALVSNVGTNLKVS